MIKTTILSLMVLAMSFLITAGIVSAQTATTSPTVSASPTMSASPTASPSAGTGGTTVPSGAPSTGHAAY